MDAKNAWWTLMEHTVCKVRGHRPDIWNTGACRRCWSERKS